MLDSEVLRVPVAPIDEQILNVEQAAKALEESVNASMKALNASIKALRKSLTKAELVETPRQFANQEKEQTEDLFIRM